MAKHHLRHPHRLIWLLIAFVIFGAAAGYVGVVEPDLISDAFSNSKGKLDEVFSGGGDQNQGPFDISADLVFNSSVEFDNAANIIMEFSKTDKRIFVNSERFDLSEIENNVIEIQDFGGQIRISEIAMLYGKAPQLSVNKIRILPEVNNLNIDLEIPYNSAELTAQAGKFSYVSTGEISFNSGQSTVNLEDEELELEDFTGNFTFTQGNLHIEGIANKVSIDGNKYSIDVK